MPEYTRVLDLDTGHEFSIHTTGLAHGNFRVIETAAIDVAGDPLPPVHAKHPGPVPPDETPASKYDGRKKADLEGEVEKRNDSRGEGDRFVEVAAPGRVAELVAALEADDAAQAAQAAAAAQNSGADSGAGLSTTAGQ